MKRSAAALAAAAAVFFLTAAGFLSGRAFLTDILPPVGECEKKASEADFDGAASALRNAEEIFRMHSGRLRLFHDETALSETETLLTLLSLSVKNKNAARTEELLAVLRLRIRDIYEKGTAFG